jgi:hypothetical protein
MVALPVPRCPRCRRAAEYQSTVEILQPPVGKIDIGYCAACECLFEHIRETGTGYDSTTWLPICRSCKQPVAITTVTGQDVDLTASYQCREHADERWHYTRRGECWVRAS